MGITIMCQGEQRRLAHLGHPKHLLDIDRGETILGRTLRLLREFEAPQPMIIARLTDGFRREAELDALTRGIGPSAKLWSAAAPGHCIVDGIATWDRAWGSDDRQVYLLGDVVWSRRALALVLGDDAADRRVAFAGTQTLNASQGEVFAVSWSGAPQNREWMTRALASCPCRTAGMRPITFSRPQGGHLRRLLWHVQHELHLRPPHGQTWHPDVYQLVDDWTSDIDDDSDLARLPELRAACASGR